MATLIIPTDAPLVTGPPQGQWTYADWEALPEDGNRYEIIDGVLYMTTAPSNFHQWIVSRLLKVFGLPAEDQGLGYAFTAPIGLLMPECDPVQPDFLFVGASNAGIIANGRIRGVPELIVEVQSPGNAAYDGRVKLVAYALAGVREYAIVRLAERSLNLFRLEAHGRYGFPVEFQADDLVAFDCMPSVTAPVSALFAGAPDTTL